MILGTFHGIRVGLNRGPDGEWVYAFETGTGGTGLGADEVEAMYETAQKIGAGATVVGEIISSAVEAGRKAIATGAV